MPEKKYPKNYFSSGKKLFAKEGYLRFFPKAIVDWYFGTQQQRLEAAIRNYDYFVPDPSGLRILEVGTGEGKFLSHCGKGNAVGIDIWADGVKKLRAQGYDVRYHDATRKFPFKGSSFDIVYSEQVIEHIGDGASFVKELNRVLRRGGKAMVRTVDIKRIGWSFYGDYTHVHPYTRESLYRIMEDHGFEVDIVSNGAPTSFLMRRLGNIALLMPGPLRKAYFLKVCPLFSYELFVIATKR